MTFKNSLKIYVASSWHNIYYPCIINILKNLEFNLYDFRNPNERNNGFHWCDIDVNWKEWSTIQYIESLKHSKAELGFKDDFLAMLSADICILVLPSGKSSHLESGFFCGHPDKKLIILMLEKQEPELMYKLADYICVSIKELIQVLNNEVLNYDK